MKRLILPDEILLRTLLDPTWVQNGKPHRSAFLLRKLDNDELSLFFEKITAAERFAKPINGFLDVVTGRLRGIPDWNLDIIPDPCDSDHAFVIGIPSPFGVVTGTGNLEKMQIELNRRMNLAADDIAREAASVNEYDPIGFAPADLLLR